MKVIWYNTTVQSYQFGSYEEFESKTAGKPGELLALEKFVGASERTLMKIVSELNKCQLAKSR